MANKIKNKGHDRDSKGRVSNETKDGEYKAGERKESHGYPDDGCSKEELESPSVALHHTWYDTSTEQLNSSSSSRPRRIIKRYHVMGVNFDVDARYSLIDVVGHGAYGIVCAAVDEDDQSSVAIKKIANTFEHAIFTKRTLREIRLLRLLEHENIIGLKTILPALHRDGFQDLYVVSDLMETDLSSIIKSPQPLSDDHVQFFIYQVLRGLKFLHTANVVHRDLKPRNLLVNSNCDLKICDFGLARLEEHDYNFHSAAMTDYVATRWYRAPEVIMILKSYTKALDIWSVGCILAELLGRRPIFPGSSNQNQLRLICQCLGKPEQAIMRQIRNSAIRNFITSLPEMPAVDYRELFKDAKPSACDLLASLLVFDPWKRSTAECALEHEYLAELHFPDDEPCGPTISRKEFVFEHYNYTTEELKQEILLEVQNYNIRSSGTRTPNESLPPIPSSPEDLGRQLSASHIS